METRKEEEVVHEYPAIGNYRVRVLRKAKKDGTSETRLDIREYVKADKFEGFTRRGVRLSDDDVAILHDILADTRARGWFDAD